LDHEARDQVGPLYPIWLVLLGLGLISLSLHLVIFALLFLPRRYTKRVRRFLAGLVMAQWIGGSRISQIVHELLWQRGDGP